MDPEKAMQFLYGDRALLLGVQDIIRAPAEVIVSPIQADFTPSPGCGAYVAEAAGAQLLEECHQLRKQYHRLEAGMAVYSGAGRLPYKAIIHACDPDPVQGDVQEQIQLTVSRCLQLCEVNQWASVAFPVIGQKVEGVTIEMSAKAFYYTIPHFWDARIECEVNKIILCQTNDSLETFFHAFRDKALEQPDRQADSGPQLDERENIGVVDLDEQQLRQNRDESDDWFTS